MLEASDASSSCNVVEQKPDVVIVDWALPGGGGASLVKHVRAHEERRHYLIVIAARPQPWDITAFFAAGADDFTTTTAPKEEILARVDGRMRICSWLAAHGSSRSFELDRGFDLDRIRVWRELDAIVSSEVAEMLGTSLQRAAAACDGVQCVGTVPLSITTEHVEIRIAVGLASRTSAQFVQEVLGGDASGDAMHDALREIANVAGGAVKRAALGEGVAMTIGLPTSENMFETSGVRTWTGSTPSGLQLAFGAVALSMQARSVRRSELREGMVLAGDVRNPGGMLLVAAGTRLTTTTVDRLSRFLDGNMRVEISDIVPIRASAAAL